MLRPSAREFKEKFEVLAAGFLNGKTADAIARSGRMRPVMDEISRYVLSDGKRLRPQLFCWGYWGAGGEDDAAILHASVSIELIHSYLLIHDDIIDRDEVRRGQPTVHVALGKLGADASDGHTGESLAIIAGDILSSYGFEILTESPFPPERRLAAISRLSRLLDEVSTGMVLDILSPYVGDSFGEQDIMNISHYKTAVYTVDGPLQLGGLLGGASPDLLAAYSAYALPIGIAFQLRDDVLGVFGDAAETGKSTSSDLREGKRTLLVHKAFQMAPAQDVSYLREWLGNPGMGDAECERIRSIMRECGALGEVESSITRLHGTALGGLAGTVIQPDAAAFLTDLADYIVKRNK